MKVTGEFAKGKKLMGQLQKVGRSGTEPAVDYTFDYARINEEEDHMGVPCGKQRKEKNKIRTEFSSEILKERDC